MKTLIYLPNWLGDIIFALPAVKAIKQSDPDGQLGCVCPAELKELLSFNPAIDEILTCPNRKHKFDRVILLRPSTTRAMVSFFNGIPERIGYRRKGKNLFLTKKIPEPDALSIHRSHYYLNIARAIDVSIIGENLEAEFFIPDKDRARAEDLLNAEGIAEGEGYLVINPGANWVMKRWNINSFALLADKLIDELKIKVVVTGSGKDVKLASQLIARMKNKPVILAGKTNLKMLGVIFQNAQVVIANDSGPLHLARVVGATTVGLYGPTSAEVTGPLGESPGEIITAEVDCSRPCYDESCNGNICMDKISVDEVFNAAKKFIL